MSTELYNHALPVAVYNCRIKSAGGFHNAYAACGGYSGILAYLNHLVDLVLVSVSPVKVMWPENAGSSRLYIQRNILRQAYNS